MFWTDNFLSRSCAMISATINRFMYKVDEVWKMGEIKSVSADGGKRVFMVEIPVTESGTITGISMWDQYGYLAGERSENIVKASGNSLIIKIAVGLVE